jgi:hypothetical protein
MIQGQTISLIITIIFGSCYLYTESMLNLLDITSKLHIIAVFVITDLQSVFHK